MVGPPPGLTPASEGGVGGRGGPQLGAESSSAGLTGPDQLADGSPQGLGEHDSAPRHEVVQVLINWPQPVQEGKCFLVAEPVKDQYVTTYVVQLPGVSDKSLETPLYLPFFPKVMKPTVPLLTDAPRQEFFSIGNWHQRREDAGRGCACLQEEVAGMSGGGGSVGWGWWEIPPWP